MVTDCLYCGKRHEPSIRCSSVASACSGADARQADKAFVQPKYLIVRPEHEETARKLLEVEAAVSPRSSDGPAWLPEYETYLQNEYKRYVDAWKKTHRQIDAGRAQGIMVAIVQLEVLSQGHSQKETDESRDG